jgi:peptidoglycan/xylan/chitin deacetylase (PgdA/CDA1 family)
MRTRAAVGVVLVAVVAVIAVVSLLVIGSSGRHVARRNMLASRQLVLPDGDPRPAGALARLDAIGYAHIRQLARLGLPIYCGALRGNEVAFTFDDGPGPYTYLALRKLQAAGERATFFVVGRAMSYFPGWLPREQAVAAIGDHTYHHPDLQLMGDAEINSEILSTARMIRAQIGQRPYLFRPPYGARDTRVDRLVKRLGLLDIMWSMDSRDSLGADWRGIIRNVEAGLRPGAIILMHENHGQTIRALAPLLSELHRRHLRSVSLPELFATDAPSVAQVRRGLDGCGPRVVPPVLRGG